MVEFVVTAWLWMFGLAAVAALLVSAATPTPTPERRPSRYLPLPVGRPWSPKRRRDDLVAFAAALLIVGALVGVLR